jgi:surface carbohydrate biosynthesis protein
MLLKIFNTLNFIVNSKWHFNTPPRKNIVIYDSLRSESLVKYFNKNSIFILRCRRETLVWKIFIKSIILDGFNWKYFESYIILLLKEVKPKYIFSLLDNDPKLYQLKFFLPNSKVISIQNGYRGYKKDIFNIVKKIKNPKKKFRIDKLFVFNKNIGLLYKKFLDCNPVEIGSFRNNSLIFKKKKENNQLLFISEYKDKNQFNSDKEFNNFFKAEKLLIPFLYNYCKKNKIKFVICGRSNAQNELSFYKKIIPNNDWKFLEKTNSNSSYKFINSSKIIVFISSTLGYEAMARNKKIAAFTIRSNYSKLINHRFGWPIKFSSKGFFWTNKPNIKEFEKILEYLNLTKNGNYIKRISKVNSKILKFDKNNQLFLKYIKKIGINKNELSL